MQFVVKYFSEIGMKSTPVRRHFVRQSEENLRAVLRDIDPAVVLHRSWDKLRVGPGQLSLRQPGSTSVVAHFG
jgi:thiamine biosynthesis protein ThiI